MKCAPLIGFSLVLVSVNQSVWAQTPFDSGSFQRKSAGVSLVQESLGVVGDVTGGFGEMFRPQASYSIQYGNNLPSKRGSRENSYVQRASAGVGLRFADRITLNYSPSYTWYSSDALEDELSHTAVISGGWTTGQVGFSASQSYSVTSVPLVETGQQTDQESWGTTLGAAMGLTDTLSIDGSISQQIRNTNQFADVTTWSGFSWLRKKYSENLTTAIGAGGSYNAIDPGSDLISRQIKGSVSWSIGTRLHADFEAGVDFTELVDSESGTTSSPIYGLNFQYKLTEVTSLSLGARRGVNTSYYSNLYTKNQSYTFSVGQRLFGALNLDLGVSYSDSEYVSNGGFVQAPEGARLGGRGDTQTAYSAQLSIPFLRKISGTFSYQHVENDSNLERYSLSSDSYGLAISWRY